MLMDCMCRQGKDKRIIKEDSLIFGLSNQVNDNAIYQDGDD